ncbi:histidine kinase [Leptolyngbya sp. FACHB-711]|jgi:polyhydroxyalkanoate synthesis regulator phasin|uniref:histidine kinase n=1 Tax=unclassified Leptolyngbya TaxID=2650499 RepID=UPI001686E299|nr:histidine kinase [Leptolyngbya sp. FACHB-711]MBD1850501.1 histidine kinase [Cyanobacteria bacterium FACHB-502]MBD2023871.1 histidine kinase [Leptolyngbya sp. FACHB-711]
MPNSVEQNNIKEQIKADLDKARQEGQLRSDRIREIVRNAVVEMRQEVKAGSGEARSLIKDVISTVFESLQSRGKEVKEEVTASIEGVIDGISESRRAAIAKTEAEIQKLQAQVSQEENELHTDVEQTLQEIETTSKSSPGMLQEAVNTAVNALKNTEEGEMLQKRYAQLQAQLAIVKANLAARYGDQFDEVQKHLDNAKEWYESARESQPEGTTLVQQKQSDVEEKLGEAGSALARGEKRVKQLLRELLHTATTAFEERSNRSK